MFFGNAQIYLLLLDKQSHCENCIFENVGAYQRRNERVRRNRDYEYVDKDYDQPIIGLHESFAENNEGATVTNVSTIGNLEGDYLK